MNMKTEAEILTEKILELESKNKKLKSLNEFLIRELAKVKKEKKYFRKRCSWQI